MKRQRGIPLCYGIALWFAFFSLFALAEDSVVIYTGVPRAGFGDIAANLHMAKVLRDHDPTQTITVLVPDQPKGFFEVNRATNRTIPATQSVHEVLGKMVDGYNPALKDQTIDGIRYVAESNSNAIADPTTFLTFANQMSYEIPDIARRSQVRLAFDEYFPIEETQKLGRYGGRDWGTVTFLTGQPKPSNSLAGFRNAGIYIPPVKPELPQGTRQALIRNLNSKGGLVSGFEIPEEGKLAFSYTDRPESALEYLKAIHSARRTHGSPHEKDTITVVIRGKYTGLSTAEFMDQVEALKLDPHIKVVPYHFIPMDTMDQLIKVSDIPPLVTGDGSLTSAYGRAFLYEGLPHKSAAIHDFVEILKTYSPELGKGSDFRLLNAAVEGLRPDRAGVFENWGGAFYRRKNWASFINDTELQERIATASEAARKTVSIVPNIEALERLLRQLPKKTPDFITGEIVSRYARGELKADSDLSKIRDFIEKMPAMPPPVAHTIFSAMLDGRFDDYPETLRHNLNLAASMIPTDLETDIYRASMFRSANFDTSRIIPMLATISVRHPDSMGREPLEIDPTQTQSITPVSCSVVGRLK